MQRELTGDGVERLAADGQKARLRLTASWRPNAERTRAPPRDSTRRRPARNGLLAQNRPARLR